jgi:hypothetical protein
MSSDRREQTYKIGATLAVIGAGIGTSTPAWALQRVEDASRGPDGWMVLWIVLITSAALGLATRVGLWALTSLHVLSAETTRAARQHVRVMVGALVLVAMVFPYVVRQQPALGLLLLLLLGVGAAADGRAEERPLGPHRS